MTNKKPNKQNCPYCPERLKIDNHMSAVQETMRLAGHLTQLVAALYTSYLLQIQQKSELDPIDYQDFKSSLELLGYTIQEEPYQPDMLDARNRNKISVC